MIDDYLKFYEEILKSRKYHGRKLKGFRLWYFLGCRDALKALKDSQTVESCEVA